MKNKKHISIKIFSGIVTFVSLAGMVIIPITRAQQTVGIEITGPITLEAPDTLELPQTFLNTNADTLLYQAFNPENPQEMVKVIDESSQGGFTVSLTMSKFEKSGDEIPYSDVGIVTISDNTDAHSVDLTNLYLPPGLDNNTVRAPLDCNVESNAVTDAQLESYCESDPDGTGFENFAGSGETSTAKTIMDATDTTGEGQTGEYSLALGMRVRVPANTTPGDYSANFTFTLNQVAIP